MVQYDPDDIVAWRGVYRIWPYFYVRVLTELNCVFRGFRGRKRCGVWLIFGFCVGACASGVSGLSGEGGEEGCCVHTYTQVKLISITLLGCVLEVLGAVCLSAVASKVIPPPSSRQVFLCYGMLN